MKAIALTKQLLYKIDFFNTRELLRYKEEPQYRTLVGGFLSLAIIVSLLASFTSLVISTFNKINITASQIYTQDNDPPETIVTTDPDSMFMFGVEIWHHDLNTGDRYFDVILLNKWLHTGEDTNQTVQIPLEPCTKNHWASYPKVLADYDRLHMNYWLCPPMNTSFSIKGKFASELSKTLEVSVRKCKNATDPSRPCANQSTIDGYFATQQQLFYTIYFMNPLVNPSQQNYIDVYLEDNNYIIITQNSGSEGILFLSDYQITTDLSIWPFADDLVESGSLVDKFAIKNPYALTTDNDVYCFFSFYKGATTAVYTRSFTKIADTLAYIGGLFGAITTILMIFNVYNGYSFEITLGAYLFKPNDDQDENFFKTFNFLKFLAYLIYAVLKALKICTGWTSMNKYLEGRKVMLKQLDVLYLLQRVQFLERSIMTLFSDHQFKGLHLRDKFTMEEAKKTRLHYELKKNIIKRIDEIDEERRQEKKMKENDFRGNQLHVHDIFGNLGNNKVQNGRVDESADTHSKGILHMFMKKIDEMSSEQSSSNGDVIEEFDIANDLDKLKEEVRKGCQTSKKIWQKIDKQIIDRLTHSKHHRQRIQFSQDQDEHSKYMKQEQLRNDQPHQDQYIIVQGSITELTDKTRDFKKIQAKEFQKKQSTEMIEERPGKSYFKENAFEMKTLKEIALTKTVFDNDKVVQEEIVEKKQPKKKSKKKGDQNTSSARKHIDEQF